MLSLFLTICKNWTFPAGNWTFGGSSNNWLFEPVIPKIELFHPKIKLLVVHPRIGDLNLEVPELNIPPPQMQLYPPCPRPSDDADVPAVCVELVEDQMTMLMSPKKNRSGGSGKASAGVAS